ncbi:MAG: hypothetical protein LQ338_004657 [Usnochroma carphineum]|nr:MAG: hypothetical protein LQ338_004657 [Usnochroma carphineum]
MAPISGKRKRPPPAKPQQRIVKRRKDEEDLEALNQRVHDLNPKEEEIKAFDDLPLSRPTASGLKASHFKNLTDIQKTAVPLALKGSDILGAAKTGSGKTLAFLVPVLENLYRRRWTELDGLGALILSPTRELAIQIFEVLRKIGRYHTFSAGLVIGGKNLQEERERLGRMNILVCTPGRMLQHMDQTAVFEIDNLQMLVLDEADRILDMGFQSTVDAIVEHLPKERQTLLFSATQTRKVSDLARLSLKDPEYVSVHEKASSATPSTLQQNYIVTPLPEKLDTLWSFIRANLKSKILVFLSSGKQVRFVYESFRHMQPGIPLLHLHGRQKQTARLDITSKFSATKNSCLFATDVVARGLDFPAVDWVIQLDCPEDADTYIHRVGRTARFERNGRAVLFIEPTEEEGMLKRLEQKKVRVERINVRQKKQQSIKHQLQNMCFKDPELKYLGQKAFISYVKSIHLQKDKEIFKLDQLPLEEFSASLGLPGAPRIKFLKGENTKALKNAPRILDLPSSDEGEENDDQKASRNKTAPRKTRYDRMFERRNQDILSEHYTKLIDNAEDDTNEPSRPGNTTEADEDQDFLAVKRRISLSPSPPSVVSADEDDTTNAAATDGNKPAKANPASTSTEPVISHLGGPTPLKIDSNRKRRLLSSKKALLKYRPRAHKLVFDADGNPHEVYEFEDEVKFKAKGPVEEQRGEFVGREVERLREAEEEDRGLEREKRRERRERRRRREREERGEGRGVELVPFDGEEGGEGDVDGKVDGGGVSDGNGAKVEDKGETKKKWAKDDERERNRKRKGGKREEMLRPETLEELEAMASGLLG